MMTCSLALGVPSRPSTRAGMNIGALNAVLAAAERLRNSRRVDPVDVVHFKIEPLRLTGCNDRVISILVLGADVVTPADRATAD